MKRVRHSDEPGISYVIRGGWGGLLTLTVRREDCMNWFSGDNERFFGVILR